MRKTNLLLLLFFCVLLTSCGERPTKRESTESILQIASIASKNIEREFLVTNNSVGDFILGGSWRDIAHNNYNYVFIEGYGSCVDACCDGGYRLGKKIIEGEYGAEIEHPELTIGAVSFDDTESKTKHINNPDVFYIMSDNCSGWYRKDQISYIEIYSNQFKTKEGLGVGTTLEEVQETFGEIRFQVGWIEEDANALQIKINSYPNIQFILSIEDYLEDWETINQAFDNNKLSISNFKKNTQIKNLIVGEERE